MKYSTTPEFDKDFKKLLRRYRTLKEDFEFLKKYHIEPYHLKNILMPDPLPIKGFCPRGFLSCKVRKFACKSLKNRGSNSGVRVIYVYEETVQTITFIEMYFKADQENEDRSRLKVWLESNG
jgi:mRNA-degrading endonuclease RelE of RelBE toxin-antitoxin system